MPNSSTHLAAAPTTAKRFGEHVSVEDLERLLPRWNGHNGMTCGQGATSTKRPLPLIPPPRAHRYSLDVLCCPSPPTLVPEGAARWQQARLSLSPDYLPELLQGPPIPWRADLDDCCYVDEVRFVNYPYPVPFFMDQPESGKVKAYYHQIPLRFVVCPCRLAGIHTSAPSASPCCAIGLTRATGALRSRSRAETATGSRTYRAPTLLPLLASIRQSDEL